MRLVSKERRNVTTCATCQWNYRRATSENFKRGQAVCSERRCRTTHAVHPCTLHTHPPCTYQHGDVDGRLPLRAERGQRPRSMRTLHAIHQDEGSSWGSVSHRAANRRQSSVRDPRVTDRAEGGESSRTEPKHRCVNNATKSSNKRPAGTEFTIGS